jgi:hypothetical protein
MKNNGRKIFFAIALALLSNLPLIALATKTVARK